MPDLSFGLIFLGAKYEPREMKYTLPPNVHFLSEIDIYEYVPHNYPAAGIRGRSNRDKALATVERLCFDMQDGHMASFDRVYEYLSERTLTIRDLAYSNLAWSLIKSVYNIKARDFSFIDFFWTWHYAYLPVLNLFYADIPPARLYHAICTGWAGCLGVIAQKRYGVPLLLTEHGIYLNERRIEISQIEWMETTGHDDDFSLRSEKSYFKEMWTNLFNAMTKLCYDRCDAIYTLCDRNRRIQIDFGAPEDLIQIIPNGVDIKTLTPKLDIEQTKSFESKEKDQFRIGFVGRVVPIKDVKTLIRAFRMVVDKLPKAELVIMGPVDEEKQYFNECQRLVELLQLDKSIKFLGSVNVHEYYPTLDLQVLTSISEGQPLVILEGYCYGVPVVTTSVGACREMVEGMNSKDRSLGPSGIVTRIGNPEETAEAILRILRNDYLREQMSEAADKRVRRFYGYRQMIDRYRNIYETYSGQPSL
jgi:glycosyltransferase involved in cell wall biosynthesis